jgi:DNA replication protein DnaC
VAACRQKRRVRFATAAALVNELVEAKQQLQLRRVLARWERYDLIAIDEVGYVPMADLGAEFLFQVIAERAEKAAVILTTNLPFSEWTQVIPNARLCKALLDRITDRAHIIETGADSYRFRRTVEKGLGLNRVRLLSLLFGLYTASVLRAVFAALFSIYLGVWRVNTH